MNSYSRSIMECACLVFIVCNSCNADFITYNFTGSITGISVNENELIPDLDIGDTFYGFTVFDSNGWDNTPGTMFVSINGVDLLFDGENLVGGVNLDVGSDYSIVVAADGQGDIGESTFDAVSFGFNLGDTDGSAGISTLFPTSLDLSEFEQNSFNIFGRYVSTNDQIGISGQLDSLSRVPEPSLVMLSPIVLILASRYRKKNAG